MRRQARRVESEVRIVIRDAEERADLVRDGHVLADGDEWPIGAVETVSGARLARGGVCPFGGGVPPQPVATAIQAAANVVAARMLPTSEREDSFRLRF